MTLFSKSKRRGPLLQRRTVTSGLVQRRAGLLSAMFASLLLITTPVLAEDPAAVVEGVARVVDGDGIAYGDVEIRMNGIAAPEKSAPGGAESTANLKAVAEGKLVRCELNGERTPESSSYRPVGICFVGELDLNEYQVRSGHALDCPRYSQGRYAETQRMAEADGLDLSSRYELPDYCLED